MVSSEIAFCMHVQYEFGEKPPRMTDVMLGGLQVAMRHICHLF